MKGRLFAAAMSFMALSSAAWATATGGPGEVVISEMNSRDGWQVSCSNSTTQAELTVEKYDARWPGGCLKLKYKGDGDILLTCQTTQAFGGIPKLFRVWTKGEGPVDAKIRLKGLFRAPDGGSKEIWLSDYFQPYWMLNACDFRFKQQRAWGDAGDILTTDGLEGPEAVNGKYVLAGFRITHVRGEPPEGVLYFARASLWGDQLDAQNRLYFPDKERVYGFNLVDPGFELDLDGWYAYGLAVIDPTVAHGGRQSMRMTKYTAQEFLNERLQVPSSAGSRIKGVKVKFSAWCKAKNVTGNMDAKYALRYGAYYMDGSSGNNNTLPLDVGTHDWKYYELIGETDPNKEIAGVRVALTFGGNHTGTVWFDDVGCEIMGEPDKGASVELKQQPKLTPLVSPKPASVSPRWAPRKISGRDFYVPVTSSGRLTSSGQIGMLNSGNIMAFSAGFRLAMREIETLSGGKNIAPTAKAQAEVEFGTIKDVARLNDGNTDDQGCLSEPVAPVPLTGSFTLSFDGPRQIDRVILYHGSQTNKQVGFIAESFQVEYREGGQWRSIAGAARQGNRDTVTKLEFPAVKTDALRVSVQRQSDANNALLDDLLKQHFGQDVLVYGGEAYPRLNSGSVHMPARWDVTHLKRLNRELTRIFGNGWLGYMEGEWDNPVALYFELAAKGITAEGKTYQVERPKTKQAAYAIMEALFKEIQAKEEIHHGLSTWNFNHYDLQWGSCLAATELTAPVGQYPIQLAFTRGAARQFQKPWCIYLAHFMGNWNALGYGAGNLSAGLGGSFGYAYAHGPDGGGSISLERRLNYLVYLAGANLMQYEGCPLWVDWNGDGLMELSPWGKAIESWHNFTKRHPERGVTYTPIAIMLDYLHGWQPIGIKASDKSKVWGGVVPFAPEDFMVNGLMYTVWPLNAERLIDQPNFALCNANAERPWGDIFDVIVPNFPGNILKHEVLADYRVLFAVGGLTLTEDLVRELKEYVREGGTLVLNVAQVNKALLGADFLGAELLGAGETECSVSIRYVEEGQSVKDLGFETRKVKVTTAKAIAEDGMGRPLALVNAYGNGRVILTTPPYLLDLEQKILPLAGYLLKRLTADVLPMQVKGDIEYIINRNEKGWVVGLINNNGVYKNCDMRNPGWGGVKSCPTHFDGAYNPTITDDSKSSKVVIAYPGKFAGAVELVEDLPIPVTYDQGGSSVPVTVPPGDVRVVQLLD